MKLRPGLFGKLPGHGDFVRRHLPRSFVAPWDAWLSEGLQAAPDARWTPWRFHLAPGACGPDAAAGVLAPSEDSVGRRFPLTLAALGVGGTPPASWYAALEALAAEALDADALAAVLPDLPDDALAEGEGSRLWTTDGCEARFEAGFAALLAP